MFDLLAPDIEAFLHRTVPPADGKNWVEIYGDVIGTGHDVNPGDPSVQLKFLSENVTSRYKKGWRPLQKVFSRTHEAWAGELLQVRHSWAHLKPFSNDDAYRALDTAQRFAVAINAPETADAIGKIRLDLRRVTAEKDDQRTLRSAAAANPESSGLRPWREVLAPHDDVATGNFPASEFAADLYKVASAGEQDSEYAQPVEFFRRTYLTEGLKDLIGRAVRRLSGDGNASPVINLQTNFGGGKTHSMLSLWHLASGTSLSEYPQELQDLLVASGGLPEEPVRRVALVGNHFSPAGETRSGTRIKTLWGELAWQLGGAEAYELVAEADRSATNPGGALHTLLEFYAPAVILIDEWVAYARQLPDQVEPDSEVAGGTFDTQFTFAQALTEAAKATPGVLLAISIPASETGRDPNQIVVGSAEEVGGTRGLEALKRLQNVVRRVADQWRPASSSEAYDIVKQRLFTQPDAAALAAISQTARTFVEFYRRHDNDFPREARDASYEDRIKRTYPLHPELFDTLYEEWSSLDRFQRTRGVLRLMSEVIHALWTGGDAGPLIMPGSLPLAASRVNAELAQYLHDSWRAIIDADVAGEGSEPARIDKERSVFGARSLTQRLAKTVFFGAAPTIGSAHKGIETQRVFLGTAVPGDVPGNFHSALTALADRATYFYSGQGKYWYDLQANITRRAKDQAERMHKEDVWAEIVTRLSSQTRARGGFANVHICPNDTGDIPDLDEARLVILHPRFTHARNNGASSAKEFAQTATEQKGTGHRTFRNAVVYLAADQDRMAEVDTAVRDYLAWKEVLASHDLDLTQNQRNQAEERRRLANDTVDARLLGAYQWGLVPDAPNPSGPFEIAVTKVEGSAASLAERVTKKLAGDGRLAQQTAALNIKLAIDRVPKIWESGHVAVGDLWQLFASYPYMPRLRDSSVLFDGVLNQPLLLNDGFALAEGHDGERYVGLRIGTGRLDGAVTNATLIVRYEIAEQQRQQEQQQESVGEPSPDPVADPSRPGSFDIERPPVTVELDRRFFGSKTLDSERYTLDFKKISDEVLAHLNAQGIRLTVRVEIEALAGDGFDEARRRTISENATVLRFDQAGFEAE
ncbi:DUF499 domain-containing protein [Microlunatus parietis]|uniref:Swt1-like HEPN domain-containing protein n=1 Tax=Microlunatus parietis TaxID=682979 RepID=A0A7Y9I737_9ACTN|nr:DUF499 domain-containing protein [Microlunatus parietis]NYE70984.1 hypothetical protein [Microlunatus parietis]